ncbi:MAG TPA: hypothetical protein VGE37_08370, partial [Archangium sp.]
RRDPIADREARKAGAASGMVPRHQQGTNRPTDSQARQRVLRDGKPLAADEGREARPAAPKRSAPLQAVPARRDPAARNGSTTSPQRSPVLKGPGRGPTGGSS